MKVRVILYILFTFDAKRIVVDFPLRIIKQCSYKNKK